MLAAIPNNKMGRPSGYNQQIADTICEKLASGLSLRQICSEDGMPGVSTVMRWIAAHEEFREQYAHAREMQAEAMADEIMAISDDGSNDWMETNDPDNPGWRFNGEAVQRSKLRVEARKWLAAKLLPKKYGDVQTHQVDVTQQVVMLLPRQGDVQRRIEGTGVVDAEVIEPPGS